MPMIWASAALLAVALAIHSVARNRTARGKLRFAMLLAASALVIAVARSHPRGAAAIPVDLHLSELLLALGSITTIVAALLNPLLADRPSPRFPNIVQDAAIVLAFFIVATLAFRDSSLVTASAVSAIVVGFALQDTLGNAFAGLAIQIEKPFRVGHWIKVGDHEGRVEEVTWRATKLRTRGGTFIILPNSVISKDPITNYSEPIVPVRLSVEVGATYLKTPGEVKAAMFEATTQVPLALRLPGAARLSDGFRRLRDRLSPVLLGASFDEEEHALDQARSAIFYSFARHGIEIPYPIQVEHSREETSTAMPQERMAVVVDRVDLFSTLGEAERRTLTAAARARLFGPGEIIVRQGDAGQSLFIVESGEVRVTLEEGQKEVARIASGGVFGEMSLLTGDPRTATVSALTETVLLEIDAQSFRQAVLEHPSVMEAISVLVVARRAGLDRARALAHEEQAALRAQSQTLLGRIRQFLHLPGAPATGSEARA